ncbi:MAG: hypothetical protein H7223_11320 [Pedobacter sp.]|nr:hypothetical protein [Pedobacter sp.]
MDILSHLTDLLRTHKEVGIEGLGTFFKKKIPGRYDVKNHLFVPPRYSLDFSVEIKETVILSKYISGITDISTESAQYYIGLFVDDINRQIAISNEADLDSMGKLRYVDDNLTLEEQDEVNLGFEFYGLPVIREDEFSEIQQITTRELRSDEGPSNIWHFDREGSSPSTINALSDSLEDAKSTSPLWIKALIVIIVVLALGTVAAYFLKPSLFGIENVSHLPTVVKDAIIPSVLPVNIDTSSISDSNSSLNSTKTIDSTSKILPTASQDPQISHDTTTWEIIGASLTKKEVSWYIEDMKSKGFTAKPVPTMPGKKRIKMSIATFGDEESAREGRKWLIKKLKNKDLYIFQNKHTYKPI